MAAPVARPGSEHIRSRRQGRRLALVSIFEADFGQHTAEAVLERHLAESEGDRETAAFARLLVSETIADRDAIDRKSASWRPNTRSSSSPESTAPCCKPPSARCYTPRRRRPELRSPNGSSWHGSTVETRRDA